MYTCAYGHMYLISCIVVGVKKTFAMRKNKQVENPKYKYNPGQS
jgi:hypothetical protein